MPLVGPTPVDWINQQNQRKDEQMRLMMQMAMADRQFQQQQQQAQRQYEHQGALEDIGYMNAQNYQQSLSEPRPVGPTELERNYGFLQGKGYQDRDIPGMILPNMKQGQGSEGYQYDIDPTSATEMEKEFRLPPGTVSQMGPRQREDAFTTFQNRRFPKPDTNTPAGQTPQGRQLAYLNTYLQDYEQRLSSAKSAANADSRAGTGDPGKSAEAITNYESKTRIARGALSRITATGQPIPESEWKAIDEQLIGGASSGASPLAQKLAQEYGMSPEEVQKLLDGVASGTIK